MLSGSPGPTAAHGLRQVANADGLQRRDIVGGRMMLKAFALQLLMLLVAAAQAHAQTDTVAPVRIDYPVGGMLHHQTEPSAVSFQCSPVDAERIRCEFTQFEAYVIQGHPTPETQLRMFISRPPDAERCAAARAELAGVPRQTPPEPSGDADPREGLAAVVEFCETGGRTDALRAYYEREYERWQKTCTVSSHRYVQTFRRVSSDRWTTEAPPYGACGLQQFSEFIGQPGEVRYVAAYKVHNKSARDGVIGCHEIKEHEAVFGPGPRNDSASRMSCETLHFTTGCYSREFPCLVGAPAITVCY